MSQVWRKEGKKSTIRRKFTRRGMFVELLFVIVTIYLSLKLPAGCRYT